jgi:alkanesulfonate monooxygenase SsuD/methylene tetrahydromethanopterin reductase-like flavin-dependent oxidoreductase (luciferase family)
VVAEHANLWNIPGGDIDDATRRNALLDRYCTEVGRDPTTITRSIHLQVGHRRTDHHIGVVIHHVGQATNSATAQHRTPPDEREQAPTGAAPSTTKQDPPDEQEQTPTEAPLLHLASEGTRHTSRNGLLTLPPCFSPIHSRT